MDSPMSKEESYADRRQLFKNIWDTAMNIEDKAGIEINKPKVIKTLRLNEASRSIVGEKKKQRIKNLRRVCNKLLNSCDRQDIDDMFYEQMTTKGRERPTRAEDDHAKKKFRAARYKRKAKKAYRMFKKINNTKIASPDRRNEKTAKSNTSGNISPIKMNRAALVHESPLVTNKSLNIQKKNIHIQRNSTDKTPGTKDYRGTLVVYNL